MSIIAPFIVVRNLLKVYNLMMRWKQIKKLWLDVSYLPLVLTACITVGVIYVIYNQTQIILKERLRERLTSIAALAAIQIDANDVESVDTPDALKSAELMRLTKTMRKIRNNTKNVKYVYILRPTANPNMTSFVADADMIEPVDWDGNKKIDEVEIPPLPGDDYDISENPTARHALAAPAAADDVYTDKWGTFLSAYAPIRNEAGESVAVIGIDVQVDQFSALIRAMLIPFLLLSGLLLSLLTVQTIVLVRIWGNRVKFVQELDRQKDELLSIVSHQLAAPVTAIKWYLEMITDSMANLTKEQADSVKSMEGITTNLSDLVGMILDVSRIQLGKMKTDPQPLDLAAFFREILDVIEPRSKEKAQRFIKKMPEKLPTVLLDKRLTRMTVENLLTNAVKYTPEKGEVQFIVEQRGDMLYCEVRDTGCGIPKDEQGKVFDKLYRATNVRNTVEGNGFGLFAAKGAIETQGGRLWFESEENKGTTFFIELPLKYPETK